MFRTEDQWIAAYREQRGYWQHDGNYNRPHAILTGNEHSNGVFDSRMIIPIDQLMCEAASDLIDLFVANGGSIAAVDRVVGPRNGAAKLTEYLADEIEERRGLSCFWSSPAKRGNGKDVRMVFENPDSIVRNNERVLLCVDDRMTGKSIDLTAAACKKEGGVIMPYVLMLVDRSGLERTRSPKIVALITRTMPRWKPEQCPYCKAPYNSPALHAEGNWEALTATYR